MRSLHLLASAALLSVAVGAHADNSAKLVQTGDDNDATVDQTGLLNEATIRQNGTASTTTAIATRKKAVTTPGAPAQRMSRGDQPIITTPTPSAR